MREQRRLAAILVADVIGYSKLVGSDEAGTLAQLRALLTEVIEPAIAKHAGRLFKAVGDGFLVEFASAVQAVEAAQAIQQANAEGELALRIGIHVGDVVVQGDDLMGDGVNIAARIEGVADPGGIAISRQVRDQVRDKLDVALIDKGEVDLKNIARPVRVFLVAGAKAVTQSDVLALPDKPSIAVLPFQNMSGDPEQEYFADGIVEDIITALSRFKSLFVIARNSSFSYKGKSPDIRQVGKELGVRYVLEGSVRKAGSRVRITGQLIQADTGAHIWAERYEGDFTDIFDLQDKVTMDVVGAITPKLERAEIDRAKRKPTDSLDAYESYLRAMACFHSGTLENLKEAQKFCSRAIELDPDFVSALAMAAFLNAAVASRGVVLDQATIAETTRLARRAVALDRNDPVALSRSAWAQAHVIRDLDTAAEHVEVALALNPNFALAWAISGWMQVWLGKPELGVEHLSNAMRLSPLDPNIRFGHAAIAHAYFMAGRNDEAWSSAERAVRQWAVPSAYRIAAASAAVSGHSEEAAKFVTLLLELDPERRVSNLIEVLGPYRRTEDIERYKEGLRLAGLPE